MTIVNALRPARFVDRRTIETEPTPDGPRVHVTEHWTDGTTTERVMGPRETAAHLRHQTGDRDG